jgi:hypothetical protein
VRLCDIYCGETPEFLTEFCAADALIRLRDVGMNCGLEYTKFPRFADIAPYSRYDHSVGVGLIVWRFTGDIRQAVAGLLHDIATPCFAHVVDFMHGDHLRQESTEAGTGAIIAGSAPLQALLKKYGLSTPEVCDYHIYPVADNDTPRLSADRLEYTLGNLVNFGFADRAAAAEYYNDLTLSSNEQNAPEVMFRSRQLARAFFMDSMKCAEIYVSDADRFAMQALAEILRAALDGGVITGADLYGSETALIKKLAAVPEFGAKWEKFRAYHRIQRSDAPASGGSWRRVPAKKRYIDPGVAGEGRASALFPECREIIDEFLHRSQDYWVRGI